MNFIEAIKLAKQGKIMGYKDADDDIIYLSEHGEYSSTNDCLVMAHTRKLEEIDIEDILRDDWVEVGPKIELHSFEEAFKAFKNGFPIKRLEWNNYMGTYYSNDNADVTRAVVRFSMPDIEAKDWLIGKREIK